MIVDEECKNIKALAEITEPSTFMVKQTGENVELFGVNVNLPTKVTRFDSVLPKINEEIKNLNRGDLVQIELLPQKSFKCIISYES